MDHNSEVVSEGSIHLEHSNCLKIHDSTCSLQQNYPVLSIMMTGNRHSHYERVGGLLDFPTCSCTQYSRIVKRLEEFVFDLAEWSCSQVRNEVKERGDDKELITCFDGFYLTRGHYSNNSSATLHDYSTGKVAWFAHRTKCGPGQVWNISRNRD